MGSKSSEDAMDLGPFMQNYVLKNPFDHLRHPLANGSTSSTKSATPPPKSSASGTNSCSSSRGPSPVPINTTAESNQSCDAKTVSTASSQDGDKICLQAATTVRQGHFGSNVAFAYHLRNQQSAGYGDLQEWLWSNYKHYPSFSGSITMTSLHKHVELFFPHITTLVLSRVMKFTFPNCNKFISKGGANYQSLVQRPEPEDYNDPALVASVDAVKRGVMDLGKAMATYAVEESRIVRTLVWDHNFNIPTRTKTPINNLSPASTTLRRKKSPQKLNGSQTNGLGSDEGGDEEDDDDDAGSDLDLEEIVDKCRKRKHSDTTDMHKDTGPIRKSRRNRKRPSYDADFEYAFDAIVKSESDTEHADKDGRSISRGDNPSLRKLQEGTETGSGDVCVKEEVLDLTFKDIESNCVGTVVRKNVSSDSHNSRWTDRGRGRDKEEHDLHGSGLSNEDILSELEYMEERVKEKDEANRSLLHELTCARREADELRSEITRRDSQIASLADGFFSLNSQFQKMQHQFASFLSSTAVKNSQLGIMSNNNNVHSVNGS